jgi:dolichyl-phosphate-mannose-protein mannosyltransferase
MSSVAGLAQRISSNASKTKRVMGSWIESDGFAIILYSVVAFFMYEVGIGNSNKVVWDEAHFGKFASYYLNREFYFDVHPPLGKMLIALIAKFAAYKGNFKFESGAEYPEDVDYTFIRFCLAIFGAAMVPMAYATSSAFGWSKRSRHMFSLFCLFENSWLVISRFILLDSMLLFFTTASVLGMVKANSIQKRNPLSLQWFAWITFTGAMLGCVMSVKWVGLFVMALVGLHTITDLWSLLGDSKTTKSSYANHWLIRIISLIIVPLSIYLASFVAHFTVLSNSGPGDSQMSSLFQNHLNNTKLANNSAPFIAYGSTITLKNDGFGGGLLHSHIQQYPSGSKQQQVTSYHHRDVNNEFIVMRKWGEAPTSTTVLESISAVVEEGQQYVRNGDTIRLLHDSTKRSLHSHPVPAPLSKLHYEVSCYGNGSYGDVNDYWTIEVKDDKAFKQQQRKEGLIHTLTTRVYLRHNQLGCYLSSGDRTLPEWGFKQREVTCRKSKDKTSIWAFESNVNAALPPSEIKAPKPSFLSNFLHLNTAMMLSNNALLPDPDKEDNLRSNPVDWPLLYNGLRMNSWADDNIKFYLIGNPLIWWSSTISLACFVLMWAWYLVQNQRGKQSIESDAYNQFVFVGGQVAGLGWLLHFMPFLMMSRVCYLHHYLPTLYFAVIMLTHMLDHFLFNPSTARYGKSKKQLPAWLRNSLFVFIILSTYLVFQHFSHASYGFFGPANAVKLTQWRSTWNIV